MTVHENGFYKIVLADDHEVFRIGLRTLISSDPTLRIVGEAKDGEQILNVLNFIACDLIILDLWMPNLDGFSILEQMNESFPHIKRLILSMDVSPKTIGKALAKGVDGFITKEDVANNIITAVQTIRENKRYFSEEIQSYILENYDSINRNHDQLNGITDREKEIAGLVASGLTNKEISSQLNISIYTVQFHRSNLMRKLKLKNMADLVKFAVDHGLCPVN